MIPVKSIGQYAKSIVGSAMAVVTALTPFYGHEAWFPAVTAGVGVLLVCLVPKQAKTP